VNRQNFRPRAAAVVGLALLAFLSAPAMSRAQEINTDAVDSAAEFPRTASPAVDRIGAVKTAASSAAPSPAGSTGPNASQPVRLPDLSSRENVSAALQMVVMLTVLSLAPAILIMMTSFTRIIIVLSLLRQALGTQQLPPNQVLIGLAMFMTFLIMGPTWRRVNDEALKPYLDGNMEPKAALATAAVPVREFMIGQIEKNGNVEDVMVFSRFAGKAEPKRWDDVATTTLVPGIMISELKTAFFMGFKIYLPFLIIDIVISTILISMGMMKLPPVMISLPFKLLLFVLVDGWRLITAGLMGTFALT